MGSAYSVVNLFGVILQKFPQGGGVGEVDGGDAGLAGERVESFGLHVGSLFHEQGGDPLLAAERGVVEWGQFQVIAGVDVGALFHEQVRHRFRPELSNEMQGRFAPGFFLRVQLGAIFDEQLRRFLIVDEEAEELFREASLEEVLEMAAKVNKMEGFLIDEIVF